MRDLRIYCVWVVGPFPGRFSLRLASHFLASAAPRMCTKARLLVNGAVSLGVLCMVESTVSFLPCVCSLQVVGGYALPNNCMHKRFSCSARSFFCSLRHKLDVQWRLHHPILTMYGSGLPVDFPWRIDSFMFSSARFGVGTLSSENFGHMHACVLDIVSFSPPHCWSS
jgi:hypothetical protein